MTYEILTEHSYDSTDAALYCLELGLSVFPINGYGIIWESPNPPEEVALGAPPVVYEWCCTCGDLNCESPGKHPLGPAWQRQATRDPARVRAMDWRNHNIGVLTEGITVVDIDPRHGGTREWVDKHGDASTLVVRTNAGWHYYYRGETRTRIGLAPGIDIKSGVGGYVVGPGSHGEYREYVFETSKASGGFLEVPDWLRAELMRKKTDVKTELVRQAQFGAGVRNDGMTAVAGLLRRYGFSETELLGALKAVNRERCNPPLSDDEVRQVAESVARYAPESSIEALIEARPSGIMSFQQILDIKPPNYVIEQIWPEGGVNVLWGKPGTMKSFLALEWAMCRAAASGWHGFEIAENVKTLYVAAEGVFGMGLRVGNIARRHNLDKAKLQERFFMYPGSVNILDLNKAEAIYQLLIDDGYKLVIFDTLRKSMTGGDENNTQDIGRLMSMLETWSLAGVSSLLIHHASKAGGARGSSAIEGDVYNMWEVRRNQRDLETIVVPTKFKDADDNFQLNIRWEVHQGSLVSTDAEVETKDSEITDEIVKNKRSERDSKIRELRATGLSQDRIAEIVGCSQKTVSRSLTKSENP